ncbi:MAG: right-handed parallel beta-helix repeat-containing protein, partial [Candidatus Thermoplasmatota archaeon]|nr:right-handed parallel beta-helix repeat-containing protein [Candidatus Thermoplasmatota archaeon]
MTSLIVIPGGLVETASAQTTMKFDIGCKQPEKFVGDQPGARRATYVIWVTNLNTLSAGDGYVVTIEVEENTDSINWNAQLNKAGGFPGQSVSIAFTAPSSVFDKRAVFLNVTAMSGVEEDSQAFVTIQATSPGSQAQFLTTITTMNSYDPILECEDPYQPIAEGHTQDFVINITNNGQLEDTIDLNYSASSDEWNVTFYDYLTGIELFDTNNDAPDYYVDTGPISRFGFRRVIARVSCPGGTDVYRIEDIVVTGLSGNLPEEVGVVRLQSHVVSFGVSVSDNANVGFDRYYRPWGDQDLEDVFAGHNVNPGMMTSYLLYAYNTSGVWGGTGFSVEEVSDDAWQVRMEYGGVVGQNVFVPPVSGLYSFSVAYLNVTAPLDAVVGDTVDVVVAAVTGGNMRRLVFTTRVIAEKKVYLLVPNGIGAESIDLDTDLHPYDPDSGTPRLWSNVYNRLVEEGSRYNIAMGVLPAYADSDWISLLTSAYTGTTGIWAVGANITGWNDTLNKPEMSWYNHNDVRVDTVFDTINHMNPNIRMALIGGKNFTIDMCSHGPNRIRVTARNHPYYINEPHDFELGRLPAGLQNGLLQDRMSKDNPTDEWVVEAAMSVILHENPDFIFLNTMETDTIGHFCGSEIDGDQTYQKQNINPLAYPNGTRDTMQEFDMALGELFNLLEERVGLDGRNGFDDSYIIFSSDHGMLTQYLENTTVDIREILADYGITRGQNYSYALAGAAPHGCIFGIESIADQQRIKDVLENYALPDGFRPVWRVLDRNDMENGTIDIGPTAGMPFNIWSQELFDMGLFPDMMVFLHPRYQIPAYRDFLTKSTKMFTMDLPTEGYWWDEGGKLVLIGNHATYGREQLVPLIIRGPNIREGYSNTTTVSNLDIIPTICELQGWRGADRGWDYDYFRDHNAAGQPLWDVFTDWIRWSPRHQFRDDVPRSEQDQPSYVEFNIRVGNLMEQTVQLDISTDKGTLDASFLELAPGEETTVTLTTVAPDGYRTRDAAKVTAVSNIPAYNGEQIWTVVCEMMTVDPPVRDWIDGDLRIGMGQSFTIPTGNAENPYVLQVNGSVFVEADGQLTLNDFSEIRLAGNTSGRSPDMTIYSGGAAYASNGAVFTSSKHRTGFYFTVNGELSITATENNMALIQKCIGRRDRNNIGGLVLSQSSNVNIENVTIRNPESYGIYIIDAEPNIKNCTFTNNKHAGIYITTTSNTIISYPTIESCTIRKSPQGIVAISNYRDVIPNVFPTILRTNISECEKGINITTRAIQATIEQLSVSKCEYGIELMYGGNATIDDSVFMENTRFGVYMGRMASSHITRSIFRENDVGIRDACPGSAITVSDCTIYNNDIGIHVNYRLGDIPYVLTDYKIRLMDSTIEQNRIGILTEEQNNTVLSDNLTIQNNTEYGIFCNPPTETLLQIGQIWWTIRNQGIVRNNPLRLAGWINITETGVLQLENVTIDENWENPEPALYEINLKQEATMICINVTQNTTLIQIFDQSQLVVGWYLDVLVTGPEDTDIAGTHMVVTNDFSTKYYEVDSQGRATGIACTEYVQTAAERIEH